MELTAIVFYVFAFITLASAFIVVFSRNIIYSVFSLLFTFFGVAGLFGAFTGRTDDGDQREVGVALVQALPFQSQFLESRGAEGRE